MIGEIDSGLFGNDLFCFADAFIQDDITCTMGKKPCSRFECKFCHRKWPTPEEYQEEYGEEYPDDRAVYLYKGVLDSYDGSEPQTATYSWLIVSYAYAKNFRKSNPMLVGRIVCACTPWGRPE